MTTGGGGLTTARGGATSTVPTAPVDLRLLPVAVGAWGSAALVLGLSPRTAVAVAVAAWGVLVVVLLHTRWRIPGPTWRLGVVALLIGAAAGSGAAATRVTALATGPLPQLAAAGEGVAVRAVVTADPRSRLTPRGQLLVVEVRVEEVQVARTPPQRVRAPVLVLATDPAWSTVLPGQPVAVEGALRPPRDGPAPVAVLHVDETPVLAGPLPRAQQVAGALRAGLRDAAAAALPPPEAGLLPGLVDGDTSRLDPGVEEDFRAAGLAHLTAVSGSNVAIVVGAAVGLARLARAGPRATGAVGLAAVVGFAVLARPDPSVLRASVMGALGVLAVVGGRPRAAWPGLGAAVLLLVLLDPLLARSVGFALSVVATSGLLALGPPLRRRLARHLPGLAADALAVALAAQAAVTPVLLVAGLPAGPVAVPANVLAAPAVPPATLVGVAVALVAPVSDRAAALLALAAGPPVWWLVRVARTAAAASGAAPDPLVGAGVVALLVGAVLALRHRPTPSCGPRRASLVALVLGVGLLVVPAVRERLAGGEGWAPRGWALVACDVGQGDALVLRAADGTGVVVDAGPDAALVDDCLADLRIDSVPLVVLSHLHADHVDGLAAVLRGRGPTAVALGPQPEEAEAGPLSALVAAGGARLLVAEQGSAWEVGDVRLTVLGPSSAAAARAEGLNDGSLLLRADVAGLRVLLPGDLEEEGQRAALRSGVDLTADVLKVAHHGSADGDPRFVRTVGPRVAVVSVGAGNSYGHPTDEALAALAALGAVVGRTDVHGDVAVVPGPDGPVLVPRGSGRS